HHERAERRQLHRLATLETVGDFLQNEFDERGRFGTRQSYLLVDRLAQVSACDRFSRHRQPRLRRSKISMCIISPYYIVPNRSTGVIGRFQLTGVTTAATPTPR